MHAFRAFHQKGYGEPARGRPVDRGPIIVNSNPPMLRILIDPGTSAAIFDVVECSLVQRLAQAHLLSLGVFLAAEDGRLWRRSCCRLAFFSCGGWVEC
jgi:hypothetical protein